MKRMLVAVCLILSTFVVQGCSGGGDGGGLDLTGTWTWTRVVTSMVCNWNAQIGETSSSQAVLNQSGTTLVLRDRTGDVFQGTIQGNMISFSAVRNGVLLSVSGNAVSNDRAELAGSFSQGGCRLDFTETWDRISHELLFFADSPDTQEQQEPLPWIP